MRMRNRLLVTACLLLLAGGIGLGQEKNEAGAVPSAQANGQHYRMVLVVQEVEGGKVMNSRRYATDLAFTGAKGLPGMIRTGVRVPIATGTYTTEGKTQTQFTYVNYGFNVDFNSAQLEGDEMYISLTAELNSVDAASSDNPIHEPTTRENRWSAGVMVPLGKPMVVFSSDDLTSKRTIQVELTVTPVK